MDLVHSELVKLRDRMPARAARVKKLSCPRRRISVMASVHRGAAETRSGDGGGGELFMSGAAVALHIAGRPDDVRYAKVSVQQ